MDTITPYEITGVCSDDAVNAQSSIYCTRAPAKPVSLKFRRPSLSRSDSPRIAVIMEKIGLIAFKSSCVLVLFTPACLIISVKVAHNIVSRALTHLRIRSQNP